MEDVMAPTVELARFTVKPGHEEGIVADRDAAMAALSQACPGLRRATLTRLPDGSWLDILVWDTPELAEQAAAKMPQIAGVQPWVAHIAQTVSFEHAELVAEQA
jgi:hypothetical protein